MALSTGAGTSDWKVRVASGTMTASNMSQPLQQKQPANVEIVKQPDYRENYANSVQVRASLWDFFLMFGTLDQATPDSVTLKNFQGVFLSPQQAKALSSVLNQHVTQYESTFGKIELGPVATGSAVQ